MYLPKHLEETRHVLHRLIPEHPLATSVTAEDEALNVNLNPFLLDASRGELGTFVGHVARENPVWKSAVHAVPDVVIFRGPQAYITLSWFPSKQEHGKVVTT